MHCLLSRLPAELFDLVFRHVSGTAAVDRYLDIGHSAPGRLDLGHLRQLIVGRAPTMTQVCRHWRTLFLPIFHQYAIYDGGEADTLLGLEDHDCYMRRLLVHIPRDYYSYRSVVRALYGLPEHVRQGVRWLGLCMDDNTGMSMSELGALAEAFPGVRHVWMDLARLDTKARRVHPIVMGAVSASVTSLVYRDYELANARQLIALMRRTAASLEHLDLGAVGLDTAGRALWGNCGDVAPTAYPRLRVLRLTLTSKASTQLFKHSPLGMIFPRLETFVCLADYHEQLDSESCADCLDLAQAFQLELLLHCSPHIKQLCGFDVDGVFTSLGISQRQALEQLTLTCNLGRLGRHCDNLSSALDLTAMLPSLRQLRINAVFGQHMRQQLDLRVPQHTKLSVLDVSSWKITLADLEQLLNKLPQLRDVRVTVMAPAVRMDSEEFAFHIGVQRLWIDAVSGEAAAWTADGLGSLMVLLARMPSLYELLTFDRAMRWLAKAAAGSSGGDGLDHLVFNANIGLCNYDEGAVGRATSLYL
ncbi:hypothetical protein LPJ63_004244 [Coemansia sp. RSA 2711]|nr:hypothetical protein LPJ63_004244 [Coemansia sp. RSA 2711]